MFKPESMSFNTDIVITNERYTELVRKEAQLEYIKKWLAAKTVYYNYADVSDIKLLLDVKERNDKND